MSDVAINPKLKDNYDSYYDGGISDWRTLGALDKVNNIVDLCGSIPHSTVLDIGSGDGALLKRLSDLNFGNKLHAVEVSQSAVATIRARNLPGVEECKLFNGYDLPYHDRSFDLSILSHVLEHVEHPRHLLQEAARVSEYIFIEVPLEDTIRLRKDYLFDRVGHINFYSWKTVRLLAQTCDLQVVSQTITNPSLAVYQYVSHTTGTLRYGVKELLLRTSARLASRLYTYHCSLLCRKVTG